MYFDQDWQWLSQTLHYDDCDKMDHLYSIGGDYVKLKVLESGTFVTRYNGTIPIKDETDRLIALNGNGKTIYISTVPYEAYNAHMAVTFTPTSGFDGQPGLYDFGKSYSLSDMVLGSGCGAALVKDENNYITAFLDIISEQLILLACRGSEASVSWDEIAVDSIAGILPYDTVAYEVYLNVVENTVQYGVNTYLASQDDVQHTQDFTATVVRNGENRTGLITSSYVPYINAYTIDQSAYDPDSLTHVVARSLSDFNDGELVGTDANYAETSLFTWAEFAANLATKKMVIDDEVVDVTSHYSAYSNFITGQMEVLWASEASDESNDHEQTIYVSDTCWPPGQGLYWWQVGTHAQYYVMHFIDGDMSGKFAQIQSCTYDWVEEDNHFVVLKNETYIRAHTGDHVIIGPAFEVDRKATYGHFGATRINRYGYDQLGIRLLHFSAFDTNTPKTIDWTLKDIAYKAGVMSFAGSTASCSDDTMVDNSDDIVGPYGELIVHLDITDEHDMSYEQIEVLFSVYENTEDIPHYLTARLYTESGEQGLEFTIDSEVQFILPVVMEGGKQVTFYKKDNIIAIWLEHKFIGAYAFRNMFNLGESIYEPSIESSAKFYVAAYVEEESIIEWSVTRYELGTIANDIYAEQGTNAISAMQKVIRDARIKVIPNSVGGLKISKFTTRDDAGTIPDVVYTDSMGETDRVPTHIRITGEEISEYIDHDLAALRGFQFQPARTESLDEEEAYREAGRIINDTTSYSEARSERSGAQLHHEIEDKVRVSFVKLTGETVLQDCVIDSIDVTYAPGGLESRQTLRKYYEES